MTKRDRRDARRAGINDRLRRRSYSDCTIVIHEPPPGSPNRPGGHHPGDAFLPIHTAPVTRVPA